MSKENKVLRLEPFGPEQTGMAKLQLQAGDFQSEMPLQHGHVYYEDEDLGLSVGVWDTTAMQEVFGPYPGDEFIWVLEGQACMVDGDGYETLINKGETFCLRNAIPISWKQVGYLRKFYMTYANPNGSTPDATSTNDGVMVIDPAAIEGSMTIMNSTYPFEIKENTSLQRDHVLFTNDTVNMFAGMWDSTAFESRMRPFPCHELVQLLEGEITITETNGIRHLFKAGDAFFIPMGTICRWQTSDYVKKLYAILDTSSLDNTSG